VALGSGRLWSNTTAAPDAALIETALACGTVAREMIRAGLFEHRASVVDQPPNSRRDVLGCSRVRESPDRVVGSHSGRKERLRANPQTMDRNSNRRRPPTRQTNGTPIDNENVWRLGRWALPPSPPEIFRFGANPGETNRNGTLIAPRLRSWLLARRSGRVSASPCPPARSLTILSTINSWNQSPCAHRQKKITHNSLTDT